MNIWPFTRRRIAEPTFIQWEREEPYRPQRSVVSASDAARTLSARSAAQRAEQCVTERQAVRAKALEIARDLGRNDLVGRFDA